MKRNYLKIALILTLGLFLTNCEGEDGAAGPAGQNGVNGENGVDGVNGVDGQDGVGFDELVKYGNITLNLEGTRSDDLAFTDSADFKFTATQGDDISYANSLTRSGNDLNFDLYRFLSAPDDVYQETTIDLDFNVIDFGLDTQSFSFEMYVEDYAVVGTDNKYFVFDDRYSNTFASVSNFTISDFNFNEETNNLTFNYAFTVEGSDNITGNELNISGSVDVIVLERVVPTID